MALTTTTGVFPDATRPATIAAVRPMAAASSTDVPPDFMTTRLMRSFSRFKLKGLGEKSSKAVRDCVPNFERLLLLQRSGPVGRGLGIEFAQARQQLRI